MNFSWLQVRPRSLIKKLRRFDEKNYTYFIYSIPNGALVSFTKLQNIHLNSKAFVCEQQTTSSFRFDILSRT